MVQHRLVWNRLSFYADEFMAFSGQRGTKVKIFNVNRKPFFVIRDDGTEHKFHHLLF